MTELFPQRAARAGGAAVLGALRSLLDPSGTHRAGGRHSAAGWLVVTVLCDPSELDETALPAPLADLRDRLEFRIRPAPGGRGTELAARLLGQPQPADGARRLAGDDAEAELRSALREAKQLIEVGEVLIVDPAPHGNRTATPGGGLLEAWTRNAAGGGVR